MIVVDDNNLTIKGSRVDLIFDFNAIVEGLLKSSPEIVAITLAMRGAEIQQAFLASPIMRMPHGADVISELIDGAIEAVKGGKEI